MSVRLRKKKLADGRQSLYLDIYHNGKRRYDFLKLYLGSDRKANKETMRLAQSIRAKRELELNSQPHGFVPHFKQRADFVEYFERLKGSKNKSDTAWRNTLKHLKDFTGGPLRLSAIDKVWLESFQRYLLSKVAPITARTYYKKIVAALRQAIKDGLLAHNPADLVDHISAPETERAYLTFEEVKKLAGTDCKYPDVKRAFLFSCFSGLRVSDVQALRWTHIKGDRLEFRQKKTGGFEYLPLSAQALTLLGEPGEPEALVFQFPKAMATVETTLRDWAKRAKVDKYITYHVSRHTFATLALTNDVDLYTVSKLLGHKHVSTTQIYGKIIDKKKRAAVNQLPTLDL